MRLSAFLLLPITLVLSSPNPRPAPQPVAAPAPTLAARVEDAAALGKRQLTVSIFGATAVISNGVICGGLGSLTGCVGQPGTNTLSVSNSDGGIIVQTGTTGSLTTSSTKNDGVVPTAAAPARAALVAGAGVLALGLL